LAAHRRRGGWGDAANDRGAASGIEAERLHGLDRLQHALDLRPAADPQQNLAARTNERQRLIGFAAVDRAHDVDARDDRTEIIRCPADEREDVACCEAQNAAAAVEDRLAAVMADADPVLDPPLEPGQLDVRQERSGIGPRRAAGVEIGHHERSPSVSGNSLANRSGEPVGDGDTALEGGDLDPAAQGGRDVDGEPSCV
jgi:hypothetical protein